MMKVNKVAWLLTVFAVCGFVASFPGNGICQDGNKQIVAELEKIRNDDQPFNITIKTEDGRERYHVGDTVNLLFSADEDCYLYLIDIGTNGRAHMLFPNKWQKKNRAKAGVTYMVPPKESKVVFRVRGPVGTNYLKVIATREPLKSLGEEMSSEDGFAELDEPSGTFKDIGVELKKKKNWAEKEFFIKVVR
jgi:hypothetical protein